MYHNWQLNFTFHNSYIKYIFKISIKIITKKLHLTDLNNLNKAILYTGTNIIIIIELYFKLIVEFI